MDLDGRSHLSRRITKLEHIFRAVLETNGRDVKSPLLVLELRRCAELVALAEEARRRFAIGDDVTLDDCVRAERLADGAMRRLKLSDKPKPAAPDLREYIASRSGASA